MKCSCGQEKQRVELLTSVVYDCPRCDGGEQPVEYPGGAEEWLRFWVSSDCLNDLLSEEGRPSGRRKFRAVYRHVSSHPVSLSLRARDRVLAGVSNEACSWDRGRIGKHEWFEGHGNPPVVLSYTVKVT